MEGYKKNPTETFEQGKHSIEDKMRAVNINIESLAREGKDVFQENARDIVIALATLVDKLEKKLPQYESIISDESSGRLMALFFRRLINNMRKHEDDFHTIHTHFISGGFPNWPDNMRQSWGEQVYPYLQKQIDKGHIGKTLLVTEFIGRGKGIGDMLDMLDDMDIDYDLVALSSANLPENLPQNVRNNLIYGKIGEVGQHLHSHGDKEGIGYYNPNLVLKDFNEEQNSPHPIRDERASVEQGMKARDFMNSVADEFLKLV